MLIVPLGKTRVSVEKLWQTAQHSGAWREHPGDASTQRVISAVDEGPARVELKVQMRVDKDAPSLYQNKEGTGHGRSIAQAIEGDG